MPEHLKKATIGRIVMRYSRDKNETPENRRVARRLVEQWARPVLGKAVSYKDLEAQQEADLGMSLKGKVTRLNRDREEDIVIPDSKRAVVPQFQVFDYVIRPQSNIQPSKPKPKISAARERLQKKVKVAKRK